MDYKGMQITLVLQGNEVDVLDYLMLSGLSNIKKEDYDEIMSCLHDMRSQITDILEEEIKKSK
jgi:hypothetical protein